MEIRRVIAAAITVVSCSIAGASFAEDGGALARADILAEAAHATATKLRRRWDGARKIDDKAATCLQDKVAQAVMLAKRVDERRAELRETKDAEARTKIARRLEVLEDRRVALEAEATRCTGK
ncbi:MAG: hypothetical protein HYV09_17870 [Deltaproteobacteria bacterium]|nr:hypothetical protein [Deltaproteobacteria bacterium]